MLVLVLPVMGIAAATHNHNHNHNQFSRYQKWKWKRKKKEVELTDTSDTITSKSTIASACERTWGVGACRISTAVIGCLIQTLIDIYQIIDKGISFHFFGFFLFWLEGRKPQTRAIHSIPKKSVQTGASKGSWSVCAGGINIAVISSAFTITLITIYSTKWAIRGRKRST